MIQLIINLFLLLLLEIIQILDRYLPYIIVIIIGIIILRKVSKGTSKGIKSINNTLKTNNKVKRRVMNILKVILIVIIANLMEDTVLILYMLTIGWVAYKLIKGLGNKSKQMVNRHRSNKLVNQVMKESEMYKEVRHIFRLPDRIYNSKIYQEKKYFHTSTHEMDKFSNVEFEGLVKSYLLARDEGLLNDLRKYVTLKEQWKPYADKYREVINKEYAYDGVDNVSQFKRIEKSLVEEVYRTVRPKNNPYIEVNIYYGAIAEYNDFHKSKTYELIKVLEIAEKIAESHGKDFKSFFYEYY